MIVAWAPVTDAPTAVSRWLVARNVAALERRADVSVLFLPPDVSSRAALEAALADAAAVGLVAGGHGDAYRLHGSETPPALDFENAHRLRGRWAHLIACRCGVPGGLAERLAWEGAPVVAAYEAPVHVDFEPEALDATTVALLTDLVTVTTQALAQGWRAPADAAGRPVPAGLHEAHDALLTHLDGLLEADPESDNFAGLNYLAQMLLARLRIYEAPAEQAS